MVDQLQYVYAAIQHLQHDRSTIDLAEELGVSRFAVGRMIKRALDDGLIEVRSRLAEPIDTELSRSLARAYGLDSAIVVVPPAGGEGPIRTTIATLAARLVAELVDEDDIVGLGPGRTIVETCEGIHDVPSCDVVQLTGVATTAPEQYLHAVMRLSRVAKGRMFPMPASFVTSSEASWCAITSEPAVKQALARMDRIDKVILTVGGWPHSSLLATQLADSGELAPLLSRGVVAEIGSTLLDADGGPVLSLEHRLIGISTEQLARVPMRVALGGGPGKQVAVIAAMKSGLIDMIVTDERTARFALGEP